MGSRFERAGGKDHRRAVEDKIKNDVPFHTFYSKLEELPAKHKHHDHGNNGEKGRCEDAVEHGRHQGDQLKLIGIGSRVEEYGIGIGHQSQDQIDNGTGGEDHAKEKGRLAQHLQRVLSLHIQHHAKISEQLKNQHHQQ